MKYKNCCEGVTSWRDNSLLMGAAVVLLLVIGIVLASMAFSRGGESGGETCPPGQVWSADHGHCH